MLLFLVVGIYKERRWAILHWRNIHIKFIGNEATGSLAEMGDDRYGTTCTVNSKAYLPTRLLKERTDLMDINKKSLITYCGIFTQTVAKQRPHKQISTEKLLSIRSASRTLLRNVEVNTHLCVATHLCCNWPTRNNEKCVRSFLCSRRRGYITRHWWNTGQFSYRYS
jgi:hypothetical protein